MHAGDEQVGGPDTVTVYTQNTVNGVLSQVMGMMTNRVTSTACCQKQVLIKQAGVRHCKLHASAASDT